MRICSQHLFSESIPSKWPHVDDITKLVTKSSSHFIYASTVMRYIWSAKESPVRSLQVVLGLTVSRTLSPFAELDALYHHIFGTAAHLDKVLRILACCSFSAVSWSIKIICIILEYSVADFYIFMADMTPLVALSQSTSDSFRQAESEVKLLHASLGDFLCDPVRSRSLHLNKEDYIAFELERCIRLFDLHSRNQCTEPEWPVYVDYKPYAILYDQILIAVETAGQLVAVQEVLRRFSLCYFHDCFQRFHNIYPDIHDEYITMLLLELNGVLSILEGVTFASQTIT